MKSRATALMSLLGLFSNVSDLLVGVPYVCKGQWQFREICDLEFPSINPDFPVGWIRLEIILIAKGRTLRFRLATVIFVARGNRNILSGHLCPIPFTGPINHKNVTQWQGAGRYHQFYGDNHNVHYNCSVLGMENSNYLTAGIEG